MRNLIPTNRVALTMDVEIVVDQPCELVLEFRDAHKPNTYYYKLRKSLKDARYTFHLSLPTTPEMGELLIYDKRVGPDSQHGAKILVKKIIPAPLLGCTVYMKPSTVSFVKFATNFAENAGIYSAGNSEAQLPHIYRSDDAKFHIDYLDVIRDKATNRIISTPASIGHKSGIIQVAQSEFIKYTVPMRLIILLHEYSHKYLNPEMGLPIEDETAADINALHLYLSLGYSPLEAHYAFLRVFNNVKSEENHKRYKVLKKFIEDFVSGKVVAGCTTLRRMANNPK